MTRAVMPDTFQMENLWWLEICETGHLGLAVLLFIACDLCMHGARVVNELSGCHMKELVRLLIDLDTSTWSWTSQAQINIRTCAPLPNL